MRNLKINGGTKLVVFFLPVFITLTLASSLISMGQGNLLIMPGRAVFEGSKKTIDINLANTGTDTARFNISMVQFRMKDDGSFEEITQPDQGQSFSDKYIRFFPRTVTLAPKEGQIVKIQLIKTTQLEPGEYRSHMYFRAVPDQKPLGEKEVKQDSSAISVRLVPIFGITIPVIIRVGQSTAKVNISNVSVETINDTITRLKLTFNRSGNMSVYGDLNVNYISPEGKVTQVGTVKGIAVYTPNTLRNFQFNLKRVNGVDYHKGMLNVEYSAQTDVKAAKLAETKFSLQ